ncbi:hypothetical protein [Enterobacter bugandensis]|uniref:hypothetical protein n=1 Tax=Enterobacter bugandensis TaxID=881260 RepID=UPI0013D3DE29|nr:hypothetical protein [Enterobacter bugandensis]
MAANSGNRFCVKPLPPNTKCELLLNDTLLDHGVLASKGVSTASVNGFIECGVKPVVEIVGGETIVFTPGLNAVLNASIKPGTNKISIHSRMTAEGALAGNYRAHKVISVSPW